MKEYWGPCLPAFSRHSWLFSERVAKAVERAFELETHAKTKGVDVIYPMEGYATSSAAGRVTVSVLSPPGRMLQRLVNASACDIQELLTASPLPMEWLVAGASFDDDNDNQVVSAESFASKTFTEPSTFPEKLRQTYGVTREEVHDAAVERAGESWEPDFFGNSLLNDTSLVVAVDIWLGGKHRRRILLTGDQENWAYITSKHPTGLGVDVLKSPHHGGQVYLADMRESKEYSVDQLYLWLRPRIVLVSAKGVHGLPHMQHRDSVRTVGAALICPNTRGLEPLTPSVYASEAGSCFSMYGCGQTGQRPHTIVSLARDDESANAPACVQGTMHRGVNPIVVLSQRIVEPDEAFVRWTRTEVEKQAKWIRDQLHTIHKDFLATVEASKTPLSTAMSQQPVSWDRLKANAMAEGRHQLAADPAGVLTYGAARGLFWLDRLPTRYSLPTEIYRTPTTAEMAKVRSWVKSLPSIVLYTSKLDWELASSRNRDAVLRKTDLSTLAAFVAMKLRIPVSFATREVLPVLITELVTSHSMRWCRADRPSEFAFARSDYNAVVHLFKGNGPTPDVTSGDWEAILWNTHSDRLEAGLRFVLEQAQVSIFAPSVLFELNSSWPSWSSTIFQYFAPMSYSSSGRSLKPGEFPKAFDNACWQTL